MNSYLYEKTNVFCAALVLTLTLLLPVNSAAVPISFVAIDCPNSVGVGQPFLARISFPSGLKNIEIQWNEGTIQPAITTTKNTSSAILLLGTRLNDEPGSKTIKVQATFNGKNISFQKNISVLPHQYQNETLTVAPEMITPPQSLKDRLDKERSMALEAIRTFSPQRLWRTPFSLPVKGKMLSRFGLHRVFNGKSKRRHKGLDFRAYKGTKIHAIAPGTVVLAGNFYYGGNSVYIDHGNGVITSSHHLSKILVKKGDFVERGQKIGLSGATGRTTGAHLHLSVYVQGINVDPEPLFTMEETKKPQS